jgi:GNAT superfamily N-acetyltransferase
MDNDIIALANAHIESYASAAAQGRDNTAPIDQLAVAYSAHYLPTWTAFSLGTAHATTSAEQTNGHLVYVLELYRRKGLGTDVRKVRSRVEQVSETSAICFITWKIVVPKGSEREVDSGVGEDAIEFQDVYGFRIADNGVMKGGWEYVVPDQEVLAVLARVPDLYG